MNTPSIGMSDEELIQWMVIQAPLTEVEAWGLYPAMELYCAQHPTAIGVLAERIVVLLMGGMTWTTIRRRLVKADDL